MAKDPVCGMIVDEKIALRMEYKGRTYYFCSTNCFGQFKQNPEGFVR